MPADDRDPPDDDSPPPDDADAPDDDADPPIEGDDAAAPRLDPAVVRAFLSSKNALAIARSAVRKLVPHDQVDDLAADAIVRALRARPPAVEAVLPAWLIAIADRTAIRWLEKRARRSKYEAPMPTRAASVDDYTGDVADDADAADPSYDPEADAQADGLLGSALDHCIGDNKKDQDTRAILREHAEDRKPYSVLARERGITEAALANRIYRFKLKYAPRVRRRERFVFFFRLGAVAVGVAVAAAILWWLFLRDPGIRRDPSENEPAPAPSASARPAPTLDNALPKEAGPPPEPPFPPKETR